MLAACLGVAAAASVACRRPDSTIGSFSQDGEPSATPSTPATNDGPPVFVGKYNSTEGLATITQEGVVVTIQYTGGHAECTPAGKTLVCTWHEGEDYGAAKLTQLAGRKLVGTWGVGKSDSSGGTWEFVPVKD